MIKRRTNWSGVSVQVRRPEAYISPTNEFAVIARWIKSELSIERGKVECGLSQKPLTLEKLDAFVRGRDPRSVKRCVSLLVREGRAVSFRAFLALAEYFNWGPLRVADGLEVICGIHLNRERWAEFKRSIAKVEGRLQSKRKTEKEIMAPLRRMVVIAALRRGMCCR